jgi:hypothetical protein
MGVKNWKGSGSGCGVIRGNIQASDDYKCVKRAESAVSVLLGTPYKCKTAPVLKQALQHEVVRNG